VKKSDTIRRWRPGWPWELEILAAIFALVAIVLPLYVFYAGRTTPGDQPLAEALGRTALMQESSWDELVNIFWAFGIVGLYLIHLVLAGGALEWISTPFSHLAAPFIFSMIAYFRMVRFSNLYPEYAFVAGSPLELSCWVLGVISMTFLLARMRMARHLSRFKELTWDVVTPSHVDWSYLELISFVRPLIYAPRLYKLNSEGLLIEGYCYAMTVPMEVIRQVEAIGSTYLVTYGYYLATSRHRLVRIHLSDQVEPIFISPRDRDEFVSFARREIEARRPRTEHGHTRHGARRTTQAGGTGSSQPLPPRS